MSRITDFKNLPARFRARGPLKRIELVQELADLGIQAEPACPCLIDLLTTHDDPVLCRAILIALEKIHPPARIEAEEKLYAKREQQSWLEYAKEVSSSGTRAKQAVLNWISLLQPGDDFQPISDFLAAVAQHRSIIVCELYLSLDKYPHAAPAIIAALQKLMPDNPSVLLDLEMMIKLPECRRIIRTFIGDVGSFVKPILDDLIDDFRTNADAIDLSPLKRTLIFLSSESPTILLRVADLLRDDKSNVRQRAEQILSYAVGMNRPVTVPALQALLHDQDPHVREAVTRALASKLGPKELQRHTARDLSERLFDPSVVVRRAVSRSLVQLADEWDGLGVIDFLIRGLQDSDAEVRANCARGLGELAPFLDSRSVEALQRVACDRDQAVCGAARDALQRIEELVE